MVGIETEYCLIDKPIYVSQQDTEETKRQVLEHNLKYKELCGE